MPAPLDQEQLDAYRRDGFLLVDDRVPAELLARAQQRTRELIEASRDVSHNNDIYDLDDGHGSASPRLNRIKQPHRVDPVFLELITCEAMLGCLTSLLGPDIRLNTSKLNTKAGGGGRAVEWHQDWAFYPHTNDDLLAVGVMLSDIDLRDGPLQVVAGTHREDLLSHHHDGVFCGAIDPADPAARIAEARVLTGRAGTVSFHHARTLHGSAPNLGDSPRLLLLYELAAADAWPITGGGSTYAGLGGMELLARLRENIICGEQPLRARLADVPVMLPLPPPEDTSSIFRVQSSGRAVSGFAQAG